MVSFKISTQNQSILLDTKKFPPPNSFCINKKNIKAIVLGCDPSNFSNKNKTQLLYTVFGIGDGDDRYFKDILKNLKLIGLNLENIYVQNVIPFYMKKETSKNLLWYKIAEEALPYLRSELDAIDEHQKIPVLMTSEYIYKFLLINRKDYQSPRDLYSNGILTPIARKSNKLGRELYPLYRHYKYSLSKPEWKEYKSFLKQKLN